MSFPVRIIDLTVHAERGPAPLRVRMLSPQEQDAAEASVRAVVGRFGSISSKARENLEFVLRYHPDREQLLVLLGKFNPIDFTGVRGENTLRALCCRENERAAHMFTEALLAKFGSVRVVSSERFMRAVRSVARENRAIIPPVLLTEASSIQKPSI